jgi:predicted nucleic acid binding AN1-type Zn finger protein
MDNTLKTNEMNLVKKVKKNRCIICNKKIGLLGFECKCSPNIKFCAEHRLPENHGCTFDHKKEGLGFLADKLIKVTSEKVIKI